MYCHLMKWLLTEGFIQADLFLRTGWVPVHNFIFPSCSLTAVFLSANLSNITRSNIVIKTLMLSLRITQALKHIDS